MRRQIITVISFAVLFAVLIAGYMIFVRPLSSSGKDEKAPVETEEGEVIGITDRIFMFEHIDSADVERYEITNETGTFAMKRGGDGVFAIEGFESVPYDSDRFSKLVSLTTYTLSKTKVASGASEEKLAEYGLDKPQASWTVTTKSGKEHTVYVGGRLLTGGGYYCMYEGRNSVYVLDNDIESAVLCPIESYVNPVICASIKQDDFYKVDDFTVYKGENKLFSLRQVEESEKINKDAKVEVIMDYPTSYYPNTSEYYDVVYQYMGFIGDSCHKLGITDEDLVECGLDSPEHVITFVYGGINHALYFSEKDEEGNYYAFSNLFPEYIAKVNEESVKYLEYELIDWMDPYIYQQYITNIKELKVEAGGVSTVFELTHGLTADGSAATLAVTANGKKMSEADVANFRQYYKSLLAISVEDYIVNDEYCPMSEEELIGYYTDDNVYLSFTYTTLSGKETTLKFYRYSTRHSAATVNGVGEFYVVTDLVTKIANDTVRVLSGEEVIAFAKD